MKTVFVLLNGPAGTGKSTEIMPTLFGMLGNNYRVDTESFATPMKLFASAALGTPYNDLDKAVPREEFGGRSMREFLIDLAENYLKKQYGNDAWGRWLLSRVASRRRMADFVIIDDSGFDEEYAPLAKDHAVFIVRIERPGHDYKKDSRGYLTATPHFVLKNDGDLTQLTNNVALLAESLIAFHRKIEIND